MRNIPFSFLLLFFSGFIIPCSAQNMTGRTDKLYTMSGVGFSFPVGENSSFMRPKFSTTLGANIGLGAHNFFLYPKVSLHVFGYDQLVPEDEYNYSLQKGRATTYLLNLALGYRKMVHKFAFYGFIGGGGGFILTPRVKIDPVNNVAILNNKTNTIGIIEPGMGIEYNIGGANLFIESSYMQGLGKIQEKHFGNIPIAIGIKPNLSKLF